MHFFAFTLVFVRGVRVAGHINLECDVVRIGPDRCGAWTWLPSLAWHV